MYIFKQDIINNDKTKHSSRLSEQQTNQWVFSNPTKQSHKLVVGVAIYMFKRCQLISFVGEKVIRTWKTCHETLKYFTT